MRSDPARPTPPRARQPPLHATTQAGPPVIPPSSTHPAMPTLSAPAYTLPLLHAARHPSSTVVGLLLSSGDEITEALPILHRYASLSLTIDTALRFVSAYAADKGLTLAGVYAAHEDGSTAPGRVGERLLETVRKVNPAAVYIAVSSSRRSPAPCISDLLCSSEGAMRCWKREICAARVLFWGSRR